MIYKHLTIFLFLLISISGLTQNNLEEALQSIVANNKQLATSKQYISAKKIEYHTGINPSNPSVSADYMIGRPVEGGNQFDFLISQSLDFPSVYSKRNELASQNEALIEISQDEIRQNILLEAKLIILNLIHLNQQKEIVEKRVSSAKNLLEVYQKKFDLEDISILELNKAKIQLLDFNLIEQLLTSKIESNNQHLTSLNGGISMIISEVAYPIASVLPSFETLIDSIELYDPKIRMLTQNGIVNSAKLDLVKAESLPNFEIGYHYQSVLGQSFNGVHFGISIPLWEHKNKVQSANANIILDEAIISDLKLHNYYEIKKLYSEHDVLIQSIQEYELIFQDLNSAELLKKSLELGEMNFITYTNELQYYHTAFDNYSELIKEKHFIVAKLLKYQL